MLSLSVNLFLAWGAKKNQNQTLDTELHEQKPNLYSGSVWSQSILNDCILGIANRENSTGLVHRELDKRQRKTATIYMTVAERRHLGN